MVDVDAFDTEQIVNDYRSLVESRYPDLISTWPVLSGYNVRIGSCQNWCVVIFSDTGAPGMIASSGIGELTQYMVETEKIDYSNKAAVRAKLERHFRLKPSDGVVLVAPDGKLYDELDILLLRHEFSMGLIPVKIFLSHKGADKSKVREFKHILELLGFDPWLDEDAMQAGTEIERGILRGFSESCATVFFITPNFCDENFLASEIDYAIQEKRKKRDRFSIITLVLGSGANKGKVPELLHRYVWKEPSNDLEALREILKALPIQVGQVHWRPQI